MTTIQPDYSRSATSSPSDPIDAPVDPTGTPSSPGSPATTGSSSRLTGILAGVDTESWTPGDEADAHGAIESVNAYCRDYCPVRLACVEDACRLYRVEGRALDALGYHRNADTESVGVLGQPVTAL